MRDLIIGLSSAALIEAVHYMPLEDMLKIGLQMVICGVSIYELIKKHGKNGKE